MLLKKKSFLFGASNILSVSVLATLMSVTAMASDYRQGQDEKGVAPYSTLEASGWTIIKGTPVQSMRFDHGSLEAGPLVGIWKMTTGIIEMPVTHMNEFVTVYKGQVIATLNDGEPVELNPGDSFYVPKGSKMRWEVVTGSVEKYLLLAGDAPLMPSESH